MAIRIDTATGAAQASGGALPRARPRFPSLAGPRTRGWQRKVGRKELIFFASQMSLMMEMGTPLKNALTALVDQASNPRFAEVIRRMLTDVEEGRQLSEAMGRHPDVFDRIFVSMVHAGETGGYLKEVFDSLVKMMEKRQEMMVQLRATLTYPAVLTVMAIGVVIFVVIGVVPKFASIYAGKFHLLPINTRALMSASDLLRSHGWLLGAIVPLLVVGIRRWKHSDPGRSLIDRILLQAPLLRGVARKVYTCQLLRTLGHLLNSSVPLLQALLVTRSTFGNRHFRSFIDELYTSVEQGGRLATPFARAPFIMASVKEMVATGEETGHLAKVMMRLAEFYDTEVQRELKLMASLLEPAALVFMGIMVALIVSSVILPMFRIAGAVS